MFKNYVDYLFELKNTIDIEAKPTIKRILNIAWGLQVEKNKNYTIVSDSDTSDSDYIEEPITISEIIPFSNDENDEDAKIKITWYKKNNIYKTNYARLQCFLTAQARNILSKVMEVNINDIVRCHTDGFICTHPIDNLKISNKIGEFKIKTGTCHVINSNKVEWQNDKKK
jgi:hypothetical protein